MKYLFTIINWLFLFSVNAQEYFIPLEDRIPSSAFKISLVDLIDPITPSFQIAFERKFRPNETLLFECGVPEGAELSIDLDNIFSLNSETESILPSLGFILRLGFRTQKKR